MASRSPERLRVFRGIALACLAGLACWATGGFLVSRAAGLLLGFNWTANYAAPPGETPGSALARFGGTRYRDYSSPWAGDTDRQRLRLVRYGMSYQPSNAPPGATYQISNEPNLAFQDEALRFESQAPAFATWYHDMAVAIRAANPTAILIGPGMWNWDGAGSTCCTTGRDAYAWFVQAHQNRYGSLPQMDSIAVQVYPWETAAWDDPDTAVATGLRQISAAQAWSNGRWPVVVTEWGMLRKRFSCTLDPAQTEAERAAYTRGMLEGMAQRAVPFALYYGSHEQLCDSNGFMSWLINADGSLTIEGQAHRDLVAAPTPTTGPRTTQPGQRTRLVPVP